LGKINSYEELLELNKKYKPLLKLRNLKQEEIPTEEKDIEKRDILICGGTGCKASRSEQILRNFNRYIDLAGLTNKVHVSITGCFGFCEKGPIVKVLPDNVFYTHVTPEDVEDIVREHLMNGNVVERLLYEEPTL
jgi:NADH-quinone oxidoreductase subunit F